MAKSKKKYPNETQRKKIKIILEVLEKTGGRNVSLACRTAKISRQTYFNWLDNFDSFREKVEETKEMLLDIAETKLVMAVNNGDKWAIEFMLKTLGKDRGYTEKQEHKFDDSVSLKVKYED